MEDFKKIIVTQGDKSFTAENFNQLMWNIIQLLGEDTEILPASIKSLNNDKISKTPYLDRLVLTPADTININWNVVTKIDCLLNRATTTFTFNNPTTPSSLLMLLRNDGTAGRAVAFPASVKWANGYKGLTTTANAINAVSMYWDGDTYYATMMNDFK
jgi:hypothetical protein